MGIEQINESGSKLMISKKSTKNSPPKLPKTMPLVQLCQFRRLPCDLRGLRIRYRFSGCSGFMEDFQSSGSLVVSEKTTWWISAVSRNNCVWILRICSGYGTQEQKIAGWRVRRKMFYASQKKESYALVRIIWCVI